MVDGLFVEITPKVSVNAEEIQTPKLDWCGGDKETPSPQTAFAAVMHVIARSQGSGHFPSSRQSVYVRARPLHGCGGETLVMGAGGTSVWLEHGGR